MAVYRLRLSLVAGNIYRMSRNKDKYENNNPRRQAVYLSPEEIAAGRQPQWHGIEITGNVRNLSPSLWQFEHLTHMYLSDNKLVRLPPDVGLLVNLRTLDVSSNKLRSLPAEIGELIHLRWEERRGSLSVTFILIASPFASRELILNHNLLRVLPFEIGKLFHLHTLGLHGNPLNKDVMSLYSESSGTLKLLSYMLDNLSGECRFFDFLLNHQRRSSNKWLELGRNESKFVSGNIWVNWRVE